MRSRPSIEFTVGAVMAAVPNRDRAHIARNDFLEALVDRLVQVGEILPAFANARFSRSSGGAADDRW